MGEPAYILSALLLVAAAIIVYLFIKLSRLKSRAYNASLQNPQGIQNPQGAQGPVAGGGPGNQRPVNQGLAAPDQQEDFKVKLISIMAHNCRGALMNIRSLTDFYGKGQISKEQFNELIAEMSATARHDLDALEKTLHWVKTQLSGFECNLLEINASSLLKQTIRNNISDINRKKISLTIKDNDENWVICGDTQLLAFVMNNLLNNAVKYSHTGGEIECVIGHPAGRTSGMIRMEVIDHGVGMDEKTRERVFRHEKTIYTGTNGEKGAGIALLICKDFVEMQGGELAVKSVPDKGTVFTLLIPGRTGLASGALCDDPGKPGS